MPRGAVPASLVGDTKLSLTQEFLREQPELGGFSSGRRARDCCVPQSPAGLQGESSSCLCSLVGTSVSMRSLWLLLRSLFGQTISGKAFLTAWPPEQPRDGGSGMFFTKEFTQHRAWDCPRLGISEKQSSNAINLKGPQRQGAERDQSCWGLSPGLGAGPAVGGFAGRAGRASPGCHSPSQGSPGVMSLLLLLLFPPLHSPCSPQDAAGLAMLEL